MAPSPYLVEPLVQLRTEFNSLNPKRDKASDGWIGDVVHQGEVSDHNPDSQGRVLALDIDSTGPWPKSFDSYVQAIVARQKAGFDGRLEYVIWNRHIASRSSKWVWETYTGTSDPHTGHAHFSARHDHTGQGDGSSWGVSEEDVAIQLNADDINAILDRAAARMKEDDPADQFAIQTKAQSWKYKGGGLQGATSTLDALSDSQGIAARLADVLVAVASIPAAVAAALPADLDEAVRDSVVAAVGDALDRIHVTVDPAPEA